VAVEGSGGSGLRLRRRQLKAALPAAVGGVRDRLGRRRQGAASAVVGVQGGGGG